ncbi:hypothetical protein L6164_020635 [Bauhinia variegata]|uniref:Uncharacterized protein n=1 Tax=Bauhinia variegata TaxID=167791 RepID=A0ACB9MW29_BAUVA|nr:hypothetical protein L6164_020635 [Bauhinia variegata]
MNSNKQEVLILPMSPAVRFSHSPPELDEFAKISDEFAQDSLENDFKVNLKMDEENLRNEAVAEEKQVVHGIEEDEIVEEKEEEFSFVSTNPNAMSVWADDVFDNGYIRPMFPDFNPNLFNANGYGGGVHDGPPLWPPLKKVFIQRPGISSSLSAAASELNELGGSPEGPFCQWSRKAVAKQASPERCKKSSSTVLSELWRLRDKFRRSNRGGKDTFIFSKASYASNYSTETRKVVVK